MAATPHAARIIDDVRDLLLLVRRTLEFTAGWHVRTASSGASGIELAKTTPPDVVLVDLMMPEMDGYEVCRRLKADPATAGIPVVLLTARHDLDERRIAETGAAGRGGPQGAGGHRARVPRDGGLGQLPIVGRPPRGRGRVDLLDQRRRRHARDLPGRHREGPARARLPAGQRRARRRVGDALLH